MFSSKFIVTKLGLETGSPVNKAILEQCPNSGRLLCIG
jgi:hypothetical protein